MLAYEVSHPCKFGQTKRLASFLAQAKHIFLPSLIISHPKEEEVVPEIAIFIQLLVVYAEGKAY